MGEGIYRRSAWAPLRALPWLDLHSEVSTALARATQCPQARSELASWPLALLPVLSGCPAGALACPKERGVGPDQPGPPGPPLHTLLGPGTAMAPPWPRHPVIGPWAPPRPTRLGSARPGWDACVAVVRLGYDRPQLGVARPGLGRPPGWAPPGPMRLASTPPPAPTLPNHICVCSFHLLFRPCSSLPFVFT